MRIKKTSQVTPAPTEAQIVDGYSESSTDAYSCDYVNELQEYSTTEKRIGTWTDGKPIYRKVITGTIAEGDTLLLNVDTLINVYGSILAGSYIRPVPFALYLQGTGNYAVNVKLGSNNIVTAEVLIAGSTTSRAGTIILEYTKTTDTATT